MDYSDKVYTKVGFAIDVWKRYESSGRGFKGFLDKIVLAGLIVNWKMH